MNDIPAFPFAIPADANRQHSKVIYEGMTLRDYFAGQALAGLLNNEKFATYADKGNYCAGICYQMADMMLEARKK